MGRRLVSWAVAATLLLGACGESAPEPDEFAALVPQLDMALAVISQSLVCPASDVVEEEFDPLALGSLEEHGGRLPASLVASATMTLVRAGERSRVAIWNDTNARPLAMLVMAELESGEYALRRIRYCAP